MTRQFMLFLAIGLIAAGAGVFFTFEVNKGSHLTLEGKILKVRTLPTDEHSAIVVVDFRVRNAATLPFMVREGTITITTADGKEVEGETIARSDINRVFDYYKILGPKFNEVLIVRDRINGNQSIDRMLAARFTIPASEVDQRKAVKLTLLDVDGPKFTFAQ